MERGKLRIFFGYSAGAGKTYAMLEAARERKEGGADVVVGYLEPHDRPETMKLAEGLETLPLRALSYRGMTLREFDVDAAILRRPGILLVDELAHTNAPGSKNSKRYLDVEELVNNGIDVWTTVNVQHIESVHDLVDSATSVDVNERVPDGIFDYADEVVLVDVEPAELIERMQAGKIYPGTRAASALENFFRADNLSSLRELFMRRSADRIERKAHNGERKTKVLVLISPSPSSEKNIRVAARTAEAFHCKFSAMYVEQNGALSDRAAATLKRHMKLVRDLDGELIVKYGEDVVETAAGYVRLAGVTNLILGKTWQSIGRKMGMEDRFLERLPNVEVLIVPDSRGSPPRKKPVRAFLTNLFRSRKLLRKYRTANRTLDIIGLLARAGWGEDPERETAGVLARGFGRSCAVFGRNLSVVSWNGEDPALFDQANERAVAEWCRKNLRPAGRGTDTLREAKAIYYPVEAGGEVKVVSLSCRTGKLSVTDKLIFRQLEAVLQVVLAR